MARRRIGQERRELGMMPARKAASLDEVAALIDWAELDRLLADISGAAKGQQGWPPLALLRALLLAMWHDPSDVRLAEAIDNRASFRRFCGFAANEPTPERTTFVRFRGEHAGAHVYSAIRGPARSTENKSAWHRSSSAKEWLRLEAKAGHWRTTAENRDPRHPWRTGLGMAFRSADPGRAGDQPSESSAIRLQF